MKLDNYEKYLQLNVNIFSNIIGQDVSIYCSIAFTKLKYEDL
ncbi:MAG: hypothetical protein Kow0068_26560 [Marinilabiliales bacterium]